jgi:hypothetical protein
MDANPSSGTAYTSTKQTAHRTMGRESELAWISRKIIQIDEWEDRCDGVAVERVFSEQIVAVAGADRQECLPICGLPAVGDKLSCAGTG